MAEVVENQRDRLLHALEMTYPGWNITVEDGWWIAELCGQLTPQLSKAGVVRYIRRTDGVALGTALSQQAARRHSVGPCTFV
ncbi:hypothetical protein [Nonomuraea aridisoli]|uniref:Uncharacterized protein n=1 Tax=Nonomuraea aridisoli TaxID=2070368 RepID=A0A2W2E8Z1_9ACTN|nr:hypothetical protein [Nonomuraea aridisoli]PZG20582.1 hypothetical protein C1J01_08750 [Nonomuraea aridisoli]